MHKLNISSLVFCEAFKLSNFTSCYEMKSEQARRWSVVRQPQMLRLLLLWSKTPEVVNLGRCFIFFISLILLFRLRFYD